MTKPIRAQPARQPQSNKTGIQHDVVIERILPGGMGLGHADGKTILVELSAPGDRLRVRVDRHRGNVEFASIVEIIEGSPSRVAPACSYFGRCGGCDFQHLSYEAQLDAKVDIVRDCLRRIARVDFQGDIPITPSPNAWQYRSSAQWRFDPAKNHFGYFERGSHTICDVAECPILVPSLQDLLVTLRERMKEGKLSPDFRDFEAVAGDDDVLIVPSLEPDERRVVSRNIGGDHYVFSADGFFQINHELLPALIELATQHANGETAFDLYCGAGLFTLPLSRRFERVIGVESNPDAVTYARRNLAEAKLSNAIIECATTGGWLHANGDSNAPLDFILLDPPRAGVEKGVIEGILAERPRQISYVSCDPATLARDLRCLIDGGYILDAVSALDMFPQTHHVETVVRLSHSLLNDVL